MIYGKTYGKAYDSCRTPLSFVFKGQQRMVNAYFLTCTLGIYHIFVRWENSSWNKSFDLVSIIPLVMMRENKMNRKAENGREFVAPILSIVVLQIFRQKARTIAGRLEVYDQNKHILDCNGMLPNSVGLKMHEKQINSLVGRAITHLFFRMWNKPHT